MAALLPNKDNDSRKPQQFRSTSFGGISFQIPTRYAANQIIGHGAYGQVVSAKCVSTGKHFAIKKLENIFRHPVHAKRAIREVKILKQLQHNGIVEIHDLYMNDSCHDLYIVSPLMDTDLHKVIRSSQPLIEKQIKYFIYQILCALLYMQSAGVIHRDLKPSNIFVDLDCDLKVGDLGMAKVIDYNPNASVPMTEYVATRWYRAPEIMMWKAYGFEADIWSVGCIMAELVARKPLFPGNDAQDQLRQIFAVLGTPTQAFLGQIQNERITKWIQSQPCHAPQSLQKLLPSASSAAIDLLTKMLAYSPYKRISVSLALRHPYFEEFRDRRTESVMLDRVRFPHCVEKFDLLELKQAMVEEIKYYAAQNHYIAVTEVAQKGTEPHFSQIMPTIGQLRQFSQHRQRQQSAGIVPVQKLAMMNGTPMILTPVSFQNYNNTQMQQPMPFQMSSHSVPWVVDQKRKSIESNSQSGSVEVKENSKMEIDQ